MNHTYEVIVSNIGTVHSSIYKRDAEQVFNAYVVQSRQSIGRASGERVWRCAVSGSRLARALRVGRWQRCPSRNAHLPEDTSMILVKWRNRNKSLIVITGLSVYPTMLAAQKQIDKWSQYFPFNSYYMETVNYDYFTAEGANGHLSAL